MMMLRTFGLVSLGVLGACSVSVAPARASAASGATIVETFAPALPSAATEQRGTCWTQSIAVARDGAWRCMIGDVIADPCFSVAGHDGVVACGANPATGALGFPLRLDKPLPPKTPRSAPAQPWLFVLDDGEVCAPFTGARPRAGGDFAQWYCGAPPAARWTSVVTRIERGRTWTAIRWVDRSPGARPTPMAIRRVWE